MRHFCTYFDRHYLARGLALHHSLAKHCPDFRLYVLCLDDFAFQYLVNLQLPHLVPIALAELEAADRELFQVKQTRTRIEYYFTITAPLLLHVLNRYPEIDILSYLDADLYFFREPSPIFEELENNSILIAEHRFAHHLKHWEQYGKYNVGLVAFRVDENGLGCLRWWRKQCLDWCYDRLEEGRFADQKYLDEWPDRFKGVRVLQHVGAGLAPWNVARHELTVRRGEVFVDSHPLIFYHFHRMRTLTPYLFDPRLDDAGETCGGVLARHIYVPYARQLQMQMRDPKLRSFDTISRGYEPSIDTMKTTRSDVRRALRRRRLLFVAGPIWANLNVEPCVTLLASRTRPARTVLAQWFG